MKITIEQLLKNIENYKIGTQLELTGTIYTARDQAHKRLIALIADKKELPINLEGSCIYYCGPCPNSPSRIIGSCGPTTSSRMDIFTPTVLDNGVKILIGKGNRSKEVKESIKKNKAIYLLATGGAGALIAKKVKSSQLVAFEDLGPEAVHKLYVEDFPLIVGIDCFGNSIFERD
ncbi:MAG: FumA C-terminus/TtdB family hydratase beta subunit [Endomicrobiaceae bacterium]|nr:FumA C-terminus/TtdB family hydratase beta subunit [Endomicrobiaceae bacterium]